MKLSDQKRFESAAKAKMDVAVNKAVDNYRIDQSQLETQRTQQLQSCTTAQQRQQVNREFDAKQQQSTAALMETLQSTIQQTAQEMQQDEYTCEAMKIFLLGAIKRVFQPGCKFETMLCLVGGQGAGKSSFFRLLAVKDEWFSDDLRRLDDDNVYRKLQGHWIIEMSEMIATANAKSIEEIKSFLSKQKETYKVPYETHPADRLRQCVFAGTTNRQDFLPRDRTGNRRFIPVPVDAELAEVHILDNEEESRAYIDQLWAEAMTIYNSGSYKLAFSPAMQETLQAHQQDFMQEDAQAGMIYAFLEDYTGDRVCSKQLYAEALGNTNIPAEWETRAICEIMNTGISRGDIQGWQAHKTAKRYPKYGVQKGWERVTSPETGAEDFSPK